MNQKKNDFEVSTDDLVFQEEVKDEELHSKLGTSDIIYVDNGKVRRRTRFLIFLAIFLILLSIVSAIMGFVYMDKELKAEQNNTKVQKYDLFVTHSSGSYGGTIDSFSKYRDEKTAFSYGFSVSNNNPISLKYSIALNNSTFGSDDVDMSKINYKLYKDDQVIKEGNLFNSENNNLFAIAIPSNSTDKYVIKLWSSDLDKKLGFKFKINVNV